MDVDKVNEALDQLIDAMNLISRAIVIISRQLPSCEKNPADAQPETGVAVPGKSK